MLAALLLPVLSLTALQDGGLPRSGVSDKDLGKLTKDVNAYFEALGPDDRAAQQEALDDIEDALEKAAKRAKLERPMLAYIGDWDYVLEESKPDDRSFKANAGKGFFTHVFVDEGNDIRTAALLSLPADYGKGATLPVIVALKPPLGEGALFEDKAKEMAGTIYSDVMGTSIVLVPLGHQSEGRSAETTEVDSSWMSPTGNDVFFTSMRILFEQVRFDRSRVVLDGWDGAGLDALRLATNAPSFFAGVIDRGGEVSSPEIVLENLFGMKALYVKGSESPDDVSALVDASVDGVTITQVDSGGSALDPSDEARTQVRDWLDGAKRDLAPSEIRYRPADVVFGSNAWCQASVVNRRASSKPGDPDYPLMHAKIDRAKNTIEIDTVNVLELRVYLSDALVDMGKPVTVIVNGEQKAKTVPKRSLRHLLDNRYFFNSGDYGLYTDDILIEQIPRNTP